jgi:hypothetical protein
MHTPRRKTRCHSLPVWLRSPLGDVLGLTRRSTILRVTEGQSRSAFPRTDGQASLGRAPERTESADRQFDIITLAGHAEVGDSDCH